jgi:hypothetical protein
MGRYSEDLKEKAFQLYRQKRNCLAVSREPGMPPSSTIYEWKKSERWDERINNCQEQLQTFLKAVDSARNPEMLADDLARWEFLNKLEGLVSRLVTEGSVKPKTWRDLLETLKFIYSERRYSIGKPVSTTETRLKIDISKFLEQLPDEQIQTSLEVLERIVRTYPSK